MEQRSARFSHYLRKSSHAVLKDCSCSVPGVPWYVRIHSKSYPADDPSDPSRECFDDLWELRVGDAQVRAKLGLIIEAMLASTPS